MAQIAACTIVAHNYLPLARVLANSFRRFHPEITFYVVVVDHPAKTRLLETNDSATFLPITDIDFGDEGFEVMATIYDVMEFSTAVKPFVLRHLLKHHGCAFYFDPDIRLYSRFDPLIESTMRAGISLTPHCLEPIVRNGIGTSEHDIMQAGIYNLGYIGVTTKAERFLDWWGERLRRDAVSDPTNHLFTDQRWIDMAIPLFGPHIETSPAYNVAYWNIDQRPLSKVDGVIKVGNEPLRFFHFSGFDPTKPHWLSKHQPTSSYVSVADDPVLTSLVLDYGKEVIANRDRAGEVLAYGWGEAMPGLELTAQLRRLFRKELKESDQLGTSPPPSPFRKYGARQFRDWLLSPAKDEVRGLPRLIANVLDSRPDLQIAFPEVVRGDLTRFGEWVRTYGVREHLELRLVCPQWDPESSARFTDAGQSSQGVDVVGYLTAEMGVGEAGRLLVTALRASETEVATLNCELSGSRQLHDFKTDSSARHKTLIASVNADQLPRVRGYVGDEIFKRRHVIGQWFWELEEFPDSLATSFNLVDEIWAPTSFISEALREKAPEGLPVTTVHLPLLRPPIDDTLTKQDFGLPDRFVFLFMFDFFSVFERKNPMGLVRAFCNAFRNNEGPLLVLKTINGTKRQRELECLKWEIRNRNDVIILDSYLDSRDNASLISCSDCYVSLHRSEGLGLTMADAMNLGKPVIATGYSGNLDFMDSSNSILVPFDKILVGDNAPPYSQFATWADPDLEFAARMMIRVASDKAFADRLGLQAQKDLSDSFNARSTGLRMRSLIQDLA